MNSQSTTGDIQLELRPHYGKSNIKCLIKEVENMSINNEYNTDMDTDYLSDDESEMENNHPLPPIRKPDYDDYEEYMYWRNFDATADLFPCSNEFIRAMKHNAENNNEYSDDYSDTSNDNMKENIEENVNAIIIKPSRVFSYM